jgi:hypothetical protein
MQKGHGGHARLLVAGAVMREPQDMKLMLQNISQESSAAKPSILSSIASSSARNIAAHMVSAHASCMSCWTCLDGIAFCVMSCQMSGDNSVGVFTHSVIITI